MRRIAQILSTAGMIGAMTIAAVAAEPAGTAKEKTRIQPSPATTRVTGPLDAEGYVDFIAALNVHARQGIANDSNAYVLLIQAIGPAESRLDVIHAICDELHLPRIAATGDYIVGYEVLGPSQPDDSGRHQNPLWKQFDQAQERPWTSAEFAAIAQLMARNERPLGLVTQAVERPKYYRPIVRMKPNELLFESLLPDVQQMRSIARALRARAMLHLGEGRLDDAERDLLTLHHLASHIGAGQFLIERLVGVACEALACAGDQHLLCQPQFNASRARLYRERLLALPPTPEMVDSIEWGERLGGLDIVQAVSRGRPIREIDGTLNLSPEDLGNVPTIDWNRLAQAALVLSVDWNVTLAELNLAYDDFVAAAKTPTHADRVAAIKELELELVQRKQDSVSPLGIVQNVFGSNKQRGKTMSNILGALVLPAFGAATSAQENAATSRQLVVLGTMLREYREQHGRYPESLAALTPQFLPETPRDRFSGGPLKYSATETTYLLYSVGRNGKDEGGVMGQVPGTQANADDRAISDPPAE